MIEKTKVILTGILVVILIVAIGYSIYKLTVSAFEEPDLITSEEIVLQKVDSKLVQSYPTYYYIENCLKNLIEGCKQAKYEEVYRLYIDDYIEQYDKQEVMDLLKQLSKPEDIHELKNIYLVDEMYLLEFETNEKVNHLLMSIDNSKQYSYQFAFIK